MNENLNLVGILKDVPKGTELYSSVFGVVTFGSIDEDEKYPIRVIDTNGCTQSFTKEGFEYKRYCPGAECILFPSKEQRDWSKFKAENKKVKIELKPLDKVLMRDKNDQPWQPKFFFCLSREGGRYLYRTTGEVTYEQCIPFNADTEHLVFNTDKPDVDYDIIEWKTGKHGE